MKTLGFPISTKENEFRRALIPEHLINISNKKNIYIESGYGNILGYTDNDYFSAGVHITTRKDVLTKDIICDPKIGDAEYLDILDKQTIFGWIHAVQNKNITDKIINKHLTAYAWEDMYENGIHSFWKNNEIAGEAAVYHAFLCYGLSPYKTKVAVLGTGNTARGTIRTLNNMGADVVVYTRQMETLFKEELGKYDVIVNAVLWDTRRSDHIITRQDLSRLKKGAMIIDISCDKAGAIETSIPTTIESPIYITDGITHYVVDHTPSLLFKTTTKSISMVVSQYCDLLIMGNDNITLKNAKCIENGEILDSRIISFQKR